MATRPKKSEIDRLEKHRVALENAEKQPQISSALADSGFDAAVINEGKTIYGETRTTYEFNKREDDETSASHAEFKTLKKELFGIFTEDRKKAKIIFRNDALSAEKLAITGTKPNTYITMMEAAKIFYSVALEDMDIQGKMTRLRLMPEDLSATAAKIPMVEKARSTYLREVGESQDATQTKDAAFLKLENWMSDFYAVARIALEDRPQLLEALGINVKN